MARVITWVKKGTTHFKSIKTSRTREDWRKRIDLMNTKAQKMSLLKAYRRWLRGEFK